MKSTSHFHATNEVGGDAGQFFEVTLFITKTGLSEVHFLALGIDFGQTDCNLKTGTLETFTALSKINQWIPRSGEVEATANQFPYHGGSVFICEVVGITKNCTVDVPSCVECTSGESTKQQDNWSCQRFSLRTINIQKRCKVLATCEVRTKWKALRD